MTKRVVTAAVAVKPQTAVSTDVKTNDELASVQTPSPAEPKDSTDTASADRKVVSVRPKVTRQRITEIDKLPKTAVSKIKPAGSAAGILSKKAAATEKKPPGRPASGSKVEEKLVKKRLLTEEKKLAASSHVDVKRTMNLLVEKVDSNKEDKSSSQKRVGICCCMSCD